MHRGVGLVDRHVATSLFTNWPCGSLKISKTKQTSGRAHCAFASPIWNLLLEHSRPHPLPQPWQPPWDTPWAPRSSPSARAQLPSLRSTGPLASAACHGLFFIYISFIYLFGGAPGLPRGTGFSLVVVSRGCSPVAVLGLLSLQSTGSSARGCRHRSPWARWLWLLGSRAQLNSYSAGLSCSAACGIFMDQGSNPCLLHWQVDSLPLNHQGRPPHPLSERQWVWWGPPAPHLQDLGSAWEGVCTHHCLLPIKPG